MLHKGMGRAILYLLDQDLSQHRDLILDCCLHYYAYDQQLEDTRRVLASAHQAVGRRRLLSH